MRLDFNGSLRILHVYRTYFPDTQGGLEEVIRQICLNSQSHQVESRVFYLSDNSEPSVMNRQESTIYRFKKTFEVASCGVGLSAFSGFKKLVDWADIVHYHFPWPFGDLLHLVSQVTKPSLVTYHSDIVRQKLLLQLYRPLMTRFLHSVDRVIPTSQNYFATSEVLGQYSDKVRVIPIGLDNNSYPVLSDEQLAAQCDIHGENFFLFIGVLRYYKGLHILLDALKGSDVCCVIAGSGPIEQELKNKAQQLGLYNVRFLGRVSDEVKVALLKLCRGVVFPSHLRSEAFGVTLLEGAMYGKPLISSEIGTGTSYINLDGETGYVIPPANPVALRKAMEALHHNPDRAERMGRTARARYEKEFTGALMGKRYVELYREMVEAE